MPSFLNKKRYDEFHPEKIRNNSLEITDWGFQIDPIGLRIAINEIWDRYRKPIFITEMVLVHMISLHQIKKYTMIIE